MGRTKAGAAHVAFAAPSRNAVLDFFTAALKAGGRIHGEPAIRDPESGYYSAAVLDFDNNSIEVRHREGTKAEPSRLVNEPVENESVLNWQKDVAKSTASNSSPAKSPSSRVVINNFTVPAMVVSQPIPESKPKSDVSTKALIGTLLGAAAGAAVAYAMTKAEDESHKTAASRTITYQAVEAPNRRPASSATIHPESHVQSIQHSMQYPRIQQIEYPHPPSSSAACGDILGHAPLIEDRPTSQIAAAPINLGTLIDTFIPPSEVARYPPRSFARSHTDGIIQPLRSQVPSVISRPPQPSRASSAAQTITPANFPPSSVVTEVRLARDMPLPTSRAPSVDRDMSHGCSQSVLGSVLPSDSVSQAGSRKSQGSRRSKHHSSNSGHSRRSKAGDYTTRY